jgi:hypothetical protein
MENPGGTVVSNPSENIKFKSNWKEKANMDREANNV